MVFQIQKHTLNFKFKAGTSRGVLTEKEVWFVKVFLETRPEIFGVGECSPLKGLSADYSEDYENKLREFCAAALTTGELDGEQVLKKIPVEYPSIRFGIEMALLDLQHGGMRKLFDCDFFDNKQPLPINGLVWMGPKDFMLQQIEEKISQGFHTIKIKVGAIDHAHELDILKSIRARYSPSAISIRLDANGAYDRHNVLKVMDEFARYGIHSIEQPVKPGQPDLMRTVCEKSPVPVALDEELIGIYDEAAQRRLLADLKPQYIILKPSLVGGLNASDRWIGVAEEIGIGWWMTSLLESNIGLNAIAQFTSAKNITIPQGLGTGQLYFNNISSPLVVEDGSLKYDTALNWDLKNIAFP